MAAMNRRLEGKVALITGGVSGIGACAARLFVKHGARVIIADVQDDLGNSFSDELKPDTHYVHCNVSKESDVKNAIDTAVSKYGKLDIVFSNAGIPGNASDTTVVRDGDGDAPSDYDNFKRVFDVNVYGAFLCVKHAARVMIPAKKGSIVITSSVCSATFGNIAYPYVVSKSAVVGLAKNLGVELGGFGIRVNCVSPFGVATPMLIGSLGLRDVGEADDFVSEIANLKGTTSDAEDVAEAALYLGSDESKYVSGMNLVIDGGYSTTNVAMKEALMKRASSSG